MVGVGAASAAGAGGILASAHDADASAEVTRTRAQNRIMCETNYPITKLPDYPIPSLIRTLKEGCSVVHTHFHAVDIAY